MRLRRILPGIYCVAVPEQIVILMLLHTRKTTSFSQDARVWDFIGDVVASNASILISILKCAFPAALIWLLLVLFIRAILAAARAHVLLWDAAAAR